VDAARDSSEHTAAQKAERSCNANSVEEEAMEAATESQAEEQELEQEEEEETDATGLPDATEAVSGMDGTAGSLDVPLKSATLTASAGLREEIDLVSDEG
jgi:hypothetical protein